MAEVLVPREGPAAMMLAHALGARPGPTGLEFDHHVTYEDWATIGRCLAVGFNAGHWWVGDFINFGEALFGEDASQAVPATTSDRYDLIGRILPIAHGTLQNIASMCARIPVSRRREELTFYDHEPVAAMDPEQQTHWLNLAIENGWRRTELRAAIREARNPTRAPGPAPAEPSYVPVTDRLLSAAKLVWGQCQPTKTGDYLVPAEVMAQLRAAIGED